MTSARPSLVRSTPFWALVVLSLASIAVGGWFALSQISTMNAALTAGTATGVEVYGGQSMAVIGSVILGAGVVGLLLALAVASARALVPVAPVEVVAPVAYEGPWHEEPTEDVVAEAPADAADAETATDAPAVRESEAVPASR